MKPAASRAACRRARIAARRVNAACTREGSALVVAVLAAVAVDVLEFVRTAGSDGHCTHHTDHKARQLDAVGRQIAAGADGKIDLSPSIPPLTLKLPAPEIEEQLIVGPKTSPAGKMSMTFCVASSDKVSGSVTVGNRGLQFDRLRSGGELELDRVRRTGEIVRIQEHCRSEPGPLSALLLDTAATVNVADVEVAIPWELVKTAWN